jgi:predicted ATPase
MVSRQMASLPLTNTIRHAWHKDYRYNPLRNNLEIKPLLNQKFILTPDQRLRVFVSSTLRELTEERKAVRHAIERLRLAPVMFELGARPYPPRELYRAYLDQSHIFVGIYWQSYGWVAPDETVSGLEDEYGLSDSKPKLIYVKSPAPERESRLKDLLNRIRDDDHASYKSFETPSELRRLIENDLMILLSERFEAIQGSDESIGYPSAQSENAISDLPIRATSLVGRQRELAALRELLMREELRLVTLTGPGGIGKSRLGEAVAEQVRGAFRNGVRLVSLAPVSDPSLVVDTIARTLGLGEQDGSQPLLETVKQQLRHQEMLLLLDNFEQVLEAAPVVAELLAASPGLKVLVTSRTTLHLAGEQEFPVPPLSLPDPTSLSTPHESLSQYEAVRLFIERARAVKPDFAVNNQNAPAVAEICHRLDGLPLAIELAAARVRILTPQGILSRLDKSLKLLTGGARDLPARQQTLRNTIDWSYDLLDVDEQTLFARLGVFVGGVTLEAAAQACVPEDELEVLEGVGSLVEKSLLRQEEGVGGEPRFTMLQTIRDYALEHLNESAETEQLRRRHAEFYSMLAERAEAGLRGPEQEIWLERLNEERDNLRATMRWLLETRNVEDAARLGWRIWPFWYVRGYSREGRRWMEEALVSSDALSRVGRARALVLVGIVSISLVDLDPSMPLFEEALALFRREGDKAGASLALLGAGLEALYGGDAEQAERLFEESVSHFRQTNDDWGLSLALTFLGEVPLSQRDFVRAEWYFEKGLTLSRQILNTRGTYNSLYHLALSAQAQEDYARAVHLYKEALLIVGHIRDRGNEGYCLEGLAACSAGQGSYERAARLYGAADMAFSSIDISFHPFGTDPASHQRSRALARSQLSEERWTTVWAEGRAMTSEQAVEYALEYEEMSTE